MRSVLWLGPSLATVACTCTRCWATSGGIPSGDTWSATWSSSRQRRLFSVPPTSAPSRDGTTRRLDTMSWSLHQGGRRTPMTLLKQLLTFSSSAQHQSQSSLLNINFVTNSFEFQYLMTEVNLQFTDIKKFQSTPLTKMQALSLCKNMVSEGDLRSNILNTKREVITFYQLIS